MPVARSCVQARSPYITPGPAASSAPFLCGEDPVTGNNLKHRRVWIQTLLKYQACAFAIDVGNYSILANHQHAILRTRPDIAASWPDEQVAWRWKLAWPPWEDGQWVCHPSDEEIQKSKRS